MTEVKPKFYPFESFKELIKNKKDLKMPKPFDKDDEEESDDLDIPPKAA